MLMPPVLIIGAGLAGYTVARELRKLDKSLPLTIVTADDGGFYSKPMLSNAFAQKKQAAQLLTQTAAQMAAQLDAQVMTQALVHSIDPARKTVATSAGELEYGKLVLAVGARPIRLEIAGDAAQQVMSVNHIGDYALLRRRIDEATARASAGIARITILGAGLIGCEFADDLAGGGHRVSVIDPSPAPLFALAAPALSLGLQQALTGMGVALHLGTTAASIDRTEGGLRVTLANGKIFDTDIVVSAVGLRPDITLAQGAGLHAKRGIVIDAFGRTSAPDIYALGDCAEYTEENGNSRPLPYIAPLMSAARAIAKSLAGQPTAIDLKPAPVLVKTPSYPLALLPPVPGAKGMWHVETDAARTICRHYDEQQIMTGFGLSHHEAALRQKLLADLSSTRIAESLAAAVAEAVEEAVAEAPGSVQ